MNLELTNTLAERSPVPSAHGATTLQFITLERSALPTAAIAPATVQPDISVSAISSSTSQAGMPQCEGLDCTTTATMLQCSTLECSALPVSSPAAVDALGARVQSHADGTLALATVRSVVPASTAAMRLAALRERIRSHSAKLS